MTAPKILGPGAVSVPAVLSFLGIETPDGPGPITIRDMMILVALHGAMARESSILAPAAALARQAVAVADEALRARDAERSAPSSPVPALAPPAAGS